MDWSIFRMVAVSVADILVCLTRRQWHLSGSRWWRMISHYRAQGWAVVMDSFLIRGGTRLKGKIEISGSKNSALPILAACLLAEGKTTLKSVPRLSDIDSMIKLLGELGMHIYRHEATGSTLAPDGPPLNGNL